MIRLDFDLACNMACTDLPEGWVIEIHLEKGVGLLGLFPPNGARHADDQHRTSATFGDHKIQHQKPPTFAINCKFLRWYPGDAPHLDEVAQEPARVVAKKAGSVTERCSELSMLTELTCSRALMVIVRSRYSLIPGSC
jgi:hypothetical protein